MIQPFLYQVAEDLKKRFGDNISQIAVVFNNKRPVIFLKKYLSEVYGKTIVCPALLTIQEFMALSSDKIIGNEITKFFLLFECYNQLLAEENQPLVDADFFYPVSQTILQDFDQIDFERADPMALYTYLKDLGELKQHFSDFTQEQQQFIESFWSTFSPERQVAIQEKFIALWKRLPKLYERFHKRMAASRLVTMASVYRQLAEGKASKPGFIQAFQQVAFVGFNALNKCEASLFSEWQQRGNAIFYFDADSYYFEDKIQEAGFFLRKNILQYGLKNALGKFQSNLNNEEKQIITCPVSGFAAQAKALAVQIKYVKENKAQPAQCAIVLADENLLIPLLQSIPEDAVLNVTMGFPVRQSLVFQFIQYWITIQQQLQSGIALFPSEASLQAFLSVNFLDINQEAQATILGKYRELDFADFDNYLKNISPLTQLFFTKCKTGTDCVISLESLAVKALQQKEANHTLQLIEGNLLMKVIMEIAKLKDRLLGNQPGLSVSLAMTLVKKSLFGLIVPLPGEPLEGIQIMGMLESRCLDFDDVYILGANEGNLPNAGTSNTFIPDSLRRAFGLPVAEHRESLSAYLFYRLCQRAKTIHVFYNSLVDNNTTGEVSRFVKQLIFESKISFKDLIQVPFPQEKELVPAHLRLEKSKAIQEKLAQYLSKSGRSFSASALKTFIECPLQFFMKYLAGIQEPKTVPDPFDASVLGTALHSAMQAFYREFEGKDIFITKEIIRKKSADSLPDICRKALRASLQLKPFPNKQDSRIAIAEKVLLENVKILLDYDATTVAPFKILELESNCDYSFEIDVFKNEHPVTVNFKGIIDRIDSVNNQLRIVDYKTGGDSVKIKSNWSSVFSHQSKSGNPAAFQIMLYTLLYFKKYNKLAIPHLYIIRKMDEEGTELKLGNPAIPLNNLHEHLKEFESGLTQLLQEIFDYQIPFEHNRDAQYCANSPYALFCNAAPAMLSDEED